MQDNKIKDEFPNLANRVLVDGFWDDNELLINKNYKNEKNKI